MSLGCAGTRAGLAPAGTAVPSLPRFCNPPASWHTRFQVKQSTVLLKTMKQSQMTHFLRHRKFLALLQDLKVLLLDGASV